MQKKVCSKCNTLKPLNSFHKHGGCFGGVRGTCKECVSFRRNTKDRNKQLKKRYGITLEEYNKLFELQKGCCAICGEHQANLKVSLAVDHCHSTKQVRGLLCYNCNMGLGRFKDSEELLLRAVKYLVNRV